MIAVDERIRIVLSDADVRMVKAHAAKVQEQSKALGWHHKWEPPGRDMVAQAAKAYGAELVVARVTGQPWNSGILGRGYVSRNKPPDVGTRIEVRCTLPGLWSRPGDREDYVYVHVSGSLEDGYLVNGWMEGRDIRVDANWTTGRFGPASDGWMVSIGQLHPMPIAPESWW